jgi:N-acetylmuramoyl-L-alanine amidase
LTGADKLAECMYWSAKKNLPGKKIRTDFSDKDSDYESNLYVLKHTNCPAVLTENFF